ncbi:MAG: 30S ribosomal protein S3 [bacterium]|nr:30S ribosomal protein S3 [bacterium]
MGQKVNPTAFRLPINKDWNSRWITTGTRYKNLLQDDLKIRELITKKLRPAGISRVLIERSLNKLDVTVFVSRPGMVIGRSGQGVEELKRQLEALIDQKVTLNVEEIKRPDLDAFLVGRSIADQIEKRMHPKRVIANAAERVMRSGAKGVKILVSGRLGGAEIARREKIAIGSIPLHTLRANINFATVPAKTATAGVVGVKVWIYREKEEKEG